MHESNIDDHFYFNAYSIFSKSQNPLFISDPLHILKRIRYHITPMIQDKNQFLQILNLPSMVLREDKASKMHDKLPILMLQLKNYELLCQNKLFNYIFYL